MPYHVSSIECPLSLESRRSNYLSLDYNYLMWLILEDNVNRTESFYKTASLSDSKVDVKVWRIAQQMIEELPNYINKASLISLDHDLYRHTDDDPEPGTGREVANYLSTLVPSCPVIIHSTNTDAAWGMHNELTYAGWRAELIHHLDEPNWIQTRWFLLANELTGNYAYKSLRPTIE